MDSSKRADELLALQQIKDALCGVCCPHCDHHNQTLTLRIQAADGLTIAECTHCGTEFVVVNDKLQAIKTAENTCGSACAPFHVPAVTARSLLCASGAICETAAAFSWRIV